MAEEKKENPILEDKQEILGQKQFQEQCFLMDFYEKFAKGNTQIEGSRRVVKRYENFVQIMGNPGTIMNKLLARGSKEFFQISPAEIALLQPKIRFFKTVFGNNGETVDAELIFDEFYDQKKIQEITMNKRQRGGGAGLKRFEWKDLGTNPGDTGKAFAASLFLHFQSIEDFFNETPIISKNGNLAGTISYADLIRTPPRKFIKENVFNDKFFRLKVQVGWAVPPKTNLISNTLLESIKNNTITMFLNITNHKIEYSQNGTFDVVIHYIGAVEAKLLSPESDVFYIDRELEEFQNNLIKNDEERIQKLETKIAQEGGKKGFFEAGSFFSDFERGVRDFVGQNETVRDLIGDPRIGDDQLILEKTQKDVEIRVEKKEKIVRENKIKSYRRLLERLEKDGRVFYVDVSKDELDLLGENVGGQQLSQNTVATLRSEKELRQKREATLAKIKINQFNQAFSAIDLKNAMDQSLKEKDEEEREEILNATDEKFNHSNVPKNAETVRINFIYFGDLVNVALDVLYDRQEKNQHLFDKNDENDLFRFLLGPIEIKNPLTGKKDVLSLADVPISLNLFQSWFLKKVIRPQLDKYLLRDFLRDVCSELIVRALSPACFGETFKDVKNLVSFSVFSLPTGKFDPMCPNASNGKRFGNNRIHIDRINTLSLRKGQENIENLRHYFFIYVSGYNSKELIGDFQRDAENGIYHFYVGADRGLLKKATFDRADVQYLKESRITNEDTIRKGDVFLSEPYNVKMEMIGNALFKPGMIFFIDPSSLGMGKNVPKNKRLPIGGYYSVVQTDNEILPGVFSTTINGTWIQSGLIEDQIASNNISIDEPISVERSLDEVFQ